MNTAEATYLFRHALLRDAAYQLQLPGDRARLHGLAFAIVESLCGSAPSPMGPPPVQFEPHPTDAFAEELAEHARRSGPGVERRAEALYARRAAELAERGFRLEDATRLWLALARACDGAEKGEALRRAAVTADRRGQSDLAERWLAESRELCEKFGDAQGVARGMTDLGNLRRMWGRDAEAEGLYREALAIAEGAGDRRMTSVILSNFAQALGKLARLDEAEEICRRSEALCAEIGDHSGLAMASLTLASVHGRRGRHDQARLALESAVRIHRDTDERRALAGSILKLGIHLKDTGDDAGAEAAYRESLALARATGNRLLEASCLTNLAILLDETHRESDAESLYRDALALSADFNHRRQAGHTSLALGVLLHRQQRFPEAEDLFGRAIEALEASGQTVLGAVAHGHLALLLRKTGRLAEAAAEIDAALALVHPAQSARDEGSLLCWSGLIRLSAGAAAEARGLWRRGAAILRGHNESILLAQETKSMQEECHAAGVAEFEIEEAGPASP